jgi:hypothetical protein
MHWALASLALVGVALVCHRLLSLGETPDVERGILWLRHEREEIYEPLALEIETQATILGISLNEALGERKEGKLDNAWRLIGLAACQWSWLAENVVGLLNTIEVHVPSSRSVLRVRAIDRQRFRSHSMAEFTRMRDTLDQLVFRGPRVRYQVNVRMLRRAVEALTLDFQKAHEASDVRSDLSSAVWDLIDPAFYDFDLVIKETLLAFRSLLVALPDPALSDFAYDLKPVVTHKVRSTRAAALR